MAHECVVILEHQRAFAEVSGITVVERLLRNLQRCGVDRAVILSSLPDVTVERIPETSWARPTLQTQISSHPGAITIHSIVTALGKETDTVPVFRADTVYDPRLLQFILGQPGPAVLVDSADPADLAVTDAATDSVYGKLCGAAIVSREAGPDQVVSWESFLIEAVNSGRIGVVKGDDQPIYSGALRRNLRPYWFRAPEPEHTRQAESVLLDSIQKGSQDFPALIHAPIERFLIARLCKTNVKPDHLTVAWAITAALTTLLFASGHLVFGLICAFVIGILDGLDGKQARIKVETTERGKLEHRLDSLFEVLWPTALAYYFRSSGQLPSAYFWLIAFIAVQALDGIGKGGIYYAAEQAGKPAGQFDRVVRLFGGRRNIYIWILTACTLLGVPAKSLIVMTWWEGCTAALDLPHAAWALFRLKRKRLP